MSSSESNSSDSSDSHDSQSEHTMSRLLNDLRVDDLSVRSNAVKQIPLIARTIGPKRTRAEIVPYFIENANDEDSILLLICEHLSSFTDYIGGSAYANILITPLELLVATEETAVRRKAVNALVNVLLSIEDAQVLSESLTGTVNRLSAKSWPSSRSSAVILIASMFSRLGESDKKAMISKYVELSHDHTPLVKREVASAFPKIFSHLPADYSTSLIEVFDRLSIDDHDSVRFLLVESISVVAEYEVKNNKRCEIALKVFLRLIEDISWRVRYTIAEHFHSLIGALDPDKKETALMFVNLMKDKENEVRVATLLNLGKVVPLFPVDILVDVIVPQINENAYDKSQSVRSALAKNVSSLAAVLGKENSMKMIVPIVLQIFNDDFSESRLQLISSLDPLNRVLGSDPIADPLHSAIAKLSEDSQWRIRLSMIEKIPIIATDFGVSFFNERMIKLISSWLTDVICAIRLATATTLASLTKAFGFEWTQKNFLPQLSELSSDKNYLHRITLINAIMAISPVINSENNLKHFLPIVLKLAADPVPNVRMLSARCIGVISNSLSRRIVKTQCISFLHKLREDTDRDVSDYASVALKGIPSSHSKGKKKAERGEKDKSPSPILVDE